MIYLNNYCTDFMFLVVTVCDILIYTISFPFIVFKILLLFVDIYVKKF